MRVHDVRVVCDVCVCDVGWCVWCVCDVHDVRWCVVWCV